MGACFTKDEEVNPHLSGLNDSRHVMMRRESKSASVKEAPTASYKPRKEHRLPDELKNAFDMNGDDNDDDIDDDNDDDNKDDSKDGEK
jgi:hypothetical protein